MSEKDNPAERLYRLIYETRKIHGGHVRETLAKVLDVPEDPPAEFFAAAINFLKLFDDVVESLHRVEDIDEELFIKPIYRLRNSFPLTSLDAPWDGYRNSMSEIDIRSLRHAIHELNRHPLPPKIEQDVLDQLQEEVTALYNLVEDAPTAEVPEALRGIMLEGLWEILTAIRLHKARGAAPLHHALLVNAGTLVTYWPLVEQYERNEAVSRYEKLVQRLRQIVPLAADITTVLGAGVQAVRALLSDGK